MPVNKLHMATDLKSLETNNSVECRMKGKQLKTATLVDYASKLYKNALEIISKEVQDEELAYVYLFRAMEIWNLIFQSSECKSDEKYYKLMHGKEMKNNVLLLEEYSKKLKTRYDDLKNYAIEHNDSSGIQLNNANIIEIKKINEVKGNIEVKENVITDCVPTVHKFYNEHFNLEINPEMSNTRLEADCYENRKYIQCEEFKEKLTSFHDILVLDIRARSDFELSKISKVPCVNIPGPSFNAGFSASKLGEIIINEEEKSFWNQRDQYQQLILMDWHSEEKDVIPSSPLFILLNILLKWDPSVVYKHRPLILNGGYECWLDMYPALTTNPKIKCPEKPVASLFIHFNEHEIEYPINELEEVFTPKHKSINKQIELIPKTLNIPTIDRSTKPDKFVSGTDKCHLPVNNEVEFETAKLSEVGEPMEEDKDKDIGDSDLHSTSVDASKERPQDKNLQTYPQVPSSMEDCSATHSNGGEKLYTSALKKITEKGDGDGAVYLEKLNVDAKSRSSGLKRSASSPNINKLPDEGIDYSSKTTVPTFDRSIKPNLLSSQDNYSPRGAGTDTIYLANNKESRGLTGLKNLGNLCYMNSIMQCISNTVYLTNELTKFNAKETSSSRRQIASEVSSLLRILWQGDTRITSCRSLKQRVGALRQSFSTMEQQDSHEFLTILMDWLHEDLNDPSSTLSLDGANETMGEKAWGEFKKKNESVVLNLFYGQLKSTVTCNYCQKESILFEPFSNLSVPLPPPQDTPYDKDRKCSLQDCLKLYLKGETVSGWICPSCKTPREATKKLDITRLPPVLIIHLKRFMNDMVGVGWCRKRMNMVDFPISDFDMMPYTLHESEQRFRTYNLYAVSNHYGSMDSGHYTAYCKNHVLNKWYKFDDQDVSEMSPADVRSSAAYILFYESCQLMKTTGHWSD